MFKQVILIRKDLDLSKGKIAAQACHASLKSYREAMDTHPTETKEWIREGAKKIILWVDSKAELFEIKEDMPRKIPKETIVDAGHTEIEPGTLTALGIGPWEEEEIDKFTSHLETVK